MSVCRALLTEALWAWSKEDGVSWLGSTRMHSISASQVKGRAVPENSEPVGEGVQFTRAKIVGFSQFQASWCSASFCRFVPGRHGSDCQASGLR